MNTTHKRRSCQFSLKMLLVLMTLVGVLFGIVAWPAERQRAAVRKVVALGGRVEYTDLSDNESWTVRQCRQWLPRDYFDPVIEVDLKNGYSVTNDDMRVLSELSQLRILWLSHTQITDSGLAHFRELKKLEWLYLFGTPVTDAGAAELQKALPNCEIVLH